MRATNDCNIQFRVLLQLLFFSSMHSCTLTCERKQRICCPFILFSFFKWFTFAKWKLQVSHIAFTEGLPVTDCTKEVTCIVLFIFSSTSFLESLCSIALRLHYQYLLKQLSLCDSESKESNKFSRRLGYKICITLEISKRFQMSSICEFCFGSYKLCKMKTIISAVILMHYKLERLLSNRCKSVLVYSWFWDLASWVDYRISNSHIIIPVSSSQDMARFCWV